MNGGLMTTLIDIALYLLIAGLAFAVAWFAAGNRSKNQVIIYKARAEATAVTEDNMRGTFSQLSSEALTANNEQFITLAKEILAAQQAESGSDLESRKIEIETLLKPLSEQLSALEASTKLMEKERDVAYGDIKTHLIGLQSSTSMLDKQASNLVTALTSSSNVRGDWGEVSLGNIFEMSGLREGIDFVEQQGQQEQKRPDYIVNLPGGGKIPIDAKATGKKFLEAIEEDDEADKKQLISEHAKALRIRVKDLKSKDYRSAVKGDVEAVVMFVPSEALLAVTFDAEPDLHEFAMKNDILIASPVSLLALLRTIAFQWRQNIQESNAREAIDICRELYGRFATWSEHYAKVGAKLGDAAEAFNSSVVTYKSRLNPSVKRLEELGMHDDLGKEVKSLDGIETEVRQLPAPHVAIIDESPPLD
jgi:DNA recombination protein RmuC